MSLPPLPPARHPPARPAAETADARLLAVATEHMRRFGRRRLTVVAVAEEAGMSHANVYRYFPSKADLVDAVTSNWLGGVEAGLSNIAGSPDPAADKLERLLLALARSMREEADGEPEIFGAFIDAVEDNRSIARKHRIRVRNLIDRVLEEGLSVGAFDIADKDRAIAFVLDAMHRFISPLAVRQDMAMPKAASDQRLAAMLKVVLRALSHRWT